MAVQKLEHRQQLYGQLLRRDHTLNGAILVGLDGHIVEIQARATEVLRSSIPITKATTITGMAGGAVRNDDFRDGKECSKCRQSRQHDRLVNGDDRPRLPAT